MKKIHKIIYSLIYFASQFPDNTINAMKAYKLIWLADRLHLRKYGRTITGDTYFALPKGIVPTEAKHIIDGKLNNNESLDINDYIKTLDKGNYRAIKDFDAVYFSKTDLNTLKDVFDAFGNISPQKLSKLSHQYPEWKEYEEKILNPEMQNSYKIDMDLMFENSEDLSKLFDQTELQITTAKEIFHDLY